MVICGLNTPAMVPIRLEIITGTWVAMEMVVMAAAAPGSGGTAGTAVVGSPAVGTAPATAAIGRGGPARGTSRTAAAGLSAGAAAVIPVGGGALPVLLVKVVVIAPTPGAVPVGSAVVPAVSPVIVPVVAAIAPIVVPAAIAPVIIAAAVIPSTGRSARGTPGAAAGRPAAVFVKVVVSHENHPPDLRPKGMLMYYFCIFTYFMSL